MITGREITEFCISMPAVDFAQQPECYFRKSAPTENTVVVNGITYELYHSKKLDTSTDPVEITAHPLHKQVIDRIKQVANGASSFQKLGDAFSPMSQIVLRTLTLTVDGENVSVVLDVAMSLAHADALVNNKQEPDDNYEERAELYTSEQLKQYDKTKVEISRFSPKLVDYVSGCAGNLAKELTIGQRLITRANEFSLKLVSDQPLSTIKFDASRSSVSQRSKHEDQSFLVSCPNGNVVYYNFRTKLQVNKMPRGNI